MDAGVHSNVISWLGGATPKNSYARHIYGVFLYVQSYYKFALVPANIVTFHNIVNDARTRLQQGEVEELTKKHNSTRLDGRPAWTECMELGYTHRALSWKSFGGYWEGAAQLRNRRLNRPSPEPLQVAPDLPLPVARMARHFGNLVEGLDGTGR